MSDSGHGPAPLGCLAGCLLGLDAVGLLMQVLTLVPFLQGDSPDTDCGEPGLPGAPGVPGERGEQVGAPGAGVGPCPHAVVPSDGTFPSPGLTRTAGTPRATRAHRK